MTEHEFNRYVKAVRNYKSARFQTFLLIAFTLINLIAMFAGRYFLTSIHLGTLFFRLGAVMRGDMLEKGTVQLANLALIIWIIIGLIVLAVYLILCISSKKRRFAMIAIAILLSLDTAIVFIQMFANLMYIADFILHCVVLFFVIKGCVGIKSVIDDFDTEILTTEDDILEIYNAINSDK